MATVAELETRINELETELNDLRERVSVLDAEDGRVAVLDHNVTDLQDAMRDLMEQSTDGNGVHYERDDDGKIVDHDGKLAPTVDANHELVADPN